jgi:hypothetical protein
MDDAFIDDQILIRQQVSRVILAPDHMMSPDCPNHLATRLLESKVGDVRRLRRFLVE